MKSIFKIRREQKRKKLNKTGSFIKAFAIGMNTGEKIYYDLWRLSKKKLLEQKRIATKQKDKQLVQDIINMKYEDRQDEKLKRKLK